MIPIKYLKGDATQINLNNFHKENQHYILHICNDAGGWGAGFVLALSKKWKEPERFYRESFQKDEKPQLGDAQVVRVEPQISVVNLIAQKGFGENGRPPIRYWALRKALENIPHGPHGGFSVYHMPRMGSKSFKVASLLIFASLEPPNGPLPLLEASAEQTERSCSRLLTGMETKFPKGGLSMTMDSSVGRGKPSAFPISITISRLNALRGFISFGPKRKQEIMSIENAFGGRN